MQIKLLPPVGAVNRTRGVRVPASETVKALLGEVNDKSNDALDIALTKLAKTLSKRLTLEDD
jgi:hypothetical protein